MDGTACRAVSGPLAVNLLSICVMGGKVALRGHQRVGRGLFLNLYRHLCVVS